MVKALVDKVKFLSQNEINEISAKLSAEALCRLDQKRDGDLRAQALCALKLLKDLVGDEALSHLKYKESGRPYFDGIDVDISISHTDAYVACAVSDKSSSRVGIDVESKAVADDEAKKIARRFFSVGEQDVLKKSENVRQTFLEIWTKKEALKKHLDDISPLLSFDTCEAEIFGVELATQALPHGTLSVCVRQGEVCDIKILF